MTGSSYMDLVLDGRTGGLGGHCGQESFLQPDFSDFDFVHVSLSVFYYDLTRQFSWSW